MQLVAAPERLQLAPHVRACRSDGQVILLDLRAGQYLGIGRRQANALIHRIDDWPTSPEGTDDPFDCADAGPVVDHLRARGLLILPGTQGVPRPTLPESTSTLSFDGTASSTFTATRLMRLLRCTTVTGLWMRHRSLDAIAISVARRRERAPVRSRAQEAVDGLEAVATAYERMRPLLLTKHNRCVHDSLILLGFLASEGHFPRWVIGVKTAPFGAHSWVQHGGTVLNDLHENVRRYQPILVV